MLGFTQAHELTVQVPLSSVQLSRRKIIQNRDLGRNGLIQKGAFVKFYTGVCVLALALVGCSRDTHPLDPAAATRDLLAACPVFVREILPNGAISRNSIIRPEHVSHMEPDIDREYDYFAVSVTLNPAGSRRMLSHTSANVGKEIAILCGDDEMSRPVIWKPVSDHFTFELPSVESKPGEP